VWQRPCDQLRLSTSLGYPWLTTGIPVGKPVGMETRGSESLVITGLHGSGYVFWMLQVPATGTCQTMVFFMFYLATSSAVKIMYIHELKIKLTKNQIKGKRKRKRKKEGGGDT
jgi:hypothetical protein